MSRKKMSSTTSVEGTTMPSPSNGDSAGRTEVVDTVIVERLNELGGRIESARKSMETSMSECMGAVAVIANEKLYKAEGYKNIISYLEERHDLHFPKSTVSEAVNTFREFGNIETGEIRDEWKAYGYTQLNLMRKLSDENLSIVTPKTTASELRSMIKEQKAGIPQQSESENSPVECMEDSESSVNRTEEESFKQSAEAAPKVRQMYFESIVNVEEAFAENLQQIIMESLALGEDVHIRVGGYNENKGIPV